MHDPWTLRAPTDSDLPALVDLAVDTFGPFMHAYLEQVGPVVFGHERDDWPGAYAREIPTLHDPAAHRWLTLAEVDGSPVGLVAWRLHEQARHGTIELLAVSSGARGAGLGTALGRLALDDLRRRGAEVVDVGTGGDAFHAPARRLYERLGFIAVPIVHYVQEV